MVVKLMGLPPSFHFCPSCVLIRLYVRSPVIYTIIFPVNMSLKKGRKVKLSLKTSLIQRLLCRSSILDFSIETCSKLLAIDLKYVFFLCSKASWIGEVDK